MVSVPNIPKIDPSDLAGARPLASSIPSSVIGNNAKSESTLGKIGSTIGVVAGAAFNTLETALNVVMSPITMIAFPATIGAINYLGKGVEKAGGLLKSERVSGMGKTAQKVNNIKEATFGQVVGERFGSVGRAFSNASNGAAEIAGKTVGKLADVIPLDKAREKKAAELLKEMHEILKNHEVYHAAMPDELRKYARNIITTLQANPGKITSEELKGMKDGFAKMAGNLKIGRGTGAAAAVKSLNKAMAVAGKGIDYLGRAAEWKTAGKAVADLPKTIAKSNFAAGAINTAFIAGSGLAMFGAAKGFAENLSSLKEMCSDITGKPVSTLQVISGDIPKSISGARSQLLKSLLVSETTGAMNLGLAVRSAMNSGKMSALTFFIPMGIGIGANKLMGESIIPYYSALKEAHASGQKIPAEAYAEFIGKASPDLKSRGGASSVFTKEIAKRYADANVAPAQLMQEISNGTLLKRIDVLMAENEAAKKTAVAASTVSPVINETANHYHVAALKGAEKTAIAKKRLPVFGEHTAAEMARDSQQASKILEFAI